MELISALYIVPTPIGNLADISQRALDILEQVDMIACEDTRESGKLLKHYDIKSRLIALHDHNEKQRTEWIAEQLQQNKSIALISDAGTPLISDPGYRLVSYLRQHNYQVVPIPGACAAITALSASGLPSDRFSFEGFLPSKSKARQDKLIDLQEESRTMIFYESPRRILDTLVEIKQVWGSDREVVIARELTKVYETFLSGSVDEVIDMVQSDPNQQKGEFVLVCRGFVRDQVNIPQEVKKTFMLLLNELPLKKAASITADIYGIRKKALYELGLTLK